MSAPSADTPVTFAVTFGELAVTAPTTTVSLGSAAPGGTITHLLGTVTVTDNRAALDAHWLATASSTDFTTGTGGAAQTIPASDVGYAAGGISTTGGINATATDLQLSGDPQTVVTATGGIGNNTATWDPTLDVAVPVQAVTGTYTATLTHSVA